MAIKLRLATDQDVQHLHKMGNESYRYYFAALWHQNQELEEYLDNEYGVHRILTDLKQDYIEWFIIEDIKEIGFIKLTYHADIPDEMLKGTLINKLYFRPNMTGLGYGRSVFSQIENLAKQKNDRLWLEVLAENHKAIAFYKSNGMEIIKEFTFKSATQQSTEFIMTKLV